MFLQVHRPSSPKPSCPRSPSRPRAPPRPLPSPRSSTPRQPLMGKRVYLHAGAGACMVPTAHGRPWHGRSRCLLKRSSLVGSMDNARGACVHARRRCRCAEVEAEPKKAKRPTSKNAYIFFSSEHRARVRGAGAGIMPVAACSMQARAGVLLHPSGMHAGSCRSCHAHASDHAALRCIWL